MLQRIFKRNKDKEKRRSQKCPIQHIDIFEKILPYVTELSDLLRLRKVCRSFREAIDTSKVFRNHVKSFSWAHLSEKNIKRFWKSSMLPWTHFRLLDIKHKSFYTSKGFRGILGKMKAESSSIEIRVTATDKRDKILRASVQAEIEEMCRKEGLEVTWVIHRTFDREEISRESPQVIFHYYPHPVDEQWQLLPYFNIS